MCWTLRGEVPKSYYKMDFISIYSPFCVPAKVRFQLGIKMQIPSFLNVIIIIFLEFKALQLTQALICCKAVNINS
jgi:hypothetical protein